MKLGEFTALAGILQVGMDTGAYLLAYHAPHMVSGGLPTSCFIITLPKQLKTEQNRSWSFGQLTQQVAYLR